jgi:integrase
MATYQKRGSSWRAIVRLKGVRDSGTFPSKGEAKAWATERESEIRAGDSGQIPNKTFGDLLEKYRDEISVKKAGARWETIRLTRMIEGRPNAKPPVPPDPLCSVRLVALNESHIAAWRDRRLLEVSDGTVLREWKLLSPACTIAIKEWKWLKSHPMKDVARPENPDARDRRISEDEIERILFCAGYSRNAPPCTLSARVGSIFLFAIETAMRAGEICALRWQDVNLDDRYCTVSGILPGSRKTRSSKRDVALSREAIRLIKQIPADKESEFVFRMSSTQSLDALFRKFRDKAAIEDLHFHDSRHEAITRLASKMDVLSLARMVGHRNINQLQIYYNLSAADLAHRLD